MEVTPFARSLLVANKMQRFGELRAKCPAYLRLGEGLKSIEVLGTPADQRESVETLREFMATHEEVAEERATGEDLMNYLLENKGARIMAAEKESGARLHLDRKKKCVAMSGLKYVSEAAVSRREQVEKAKAALDALQAELEEAMVKVPVTAVQMEVLLENKAAMLVRLREALHCMVEVDRAHKVVKVVAEAEDRARAKEEVEKALAGIVEAKIAIPARVGGVFVGTKGEHITSVRKQFHVALELEKEELCVGGSAENVAAAAAAIEAWVKEHTVKEMTAEPELAFPCIVGAKGATRKALEKELKVEIHVEKDGCVWVLGEASLCEAAMAKLTALLDAYARENAVVEVPEKAFRNASELRASAVEKEAKKEGVEVRCLAKSHSFALHGPEEKVATLKAQLEALAAKYAEYDELALEVPADQIGTLVGKGGDHARELQSRFGVEIQTREKDVKLWGPASALEAAKAGILADLAERVLVTKEVNCTAKQAQFLASSRGEVRAAIEQETGVFIRMPRDLPAIGPTRITLRGNARQVSEALPLVNEALQGLVREVLAFDGDELTRLLHDSDLQVQRLALEGRCRIRSDEAARTMCVVGPKEGVALVRERVFQQLGAMVPEHYRVVPVTAAARLGLEDMAKTIQAYCGQHGCSVRVAGEAVLVHAGEALEEVLGAVEAWATEAAARNCLVAVEREAIPFVIGAKGARINGISKESGAAVHILDDAFVHIAGKAEAVEKAKALVEAALAEYAACNVSFTIDPALVGAVKGARNARVMSIQRQFMVRVTIDRDGRVSISGPDGKSVQQAREAVEQAVEEAKLNPEAAASAASAASAATSTGSTTSVWGAPRGARAARSAAVSESARHEEEDGRSVWERLKNAPLLPPGSAKKPVQVEAKKDVNRLLGLNEATVGGSECYKSETGYSVAF